MSLVGIMILVEIWGYILSKEDKSKKALGSPGWRNFSVQNPKCREGLGIGGREDRRQTSQTGLDCTLETKPVSLSDHSNHKIDESPCDFLTGSKCERSF